MKFRALEHNHKYGDIYNRDNVYDGYEWTYKKSEGYEIIGSLNGCVFADLEDLSVSVTKEMAPIPELARGKHGVAGSMIFYNWDTLLIWEQRDREHPDMIPPFKIEIKKDGNIVASIEGIELINEGRGVYADDIVRKHKATFMATKLNKEKQ
jgi:hypothetical protein